MIYKLSNDIKNDDVIFMMYSNTTIFDKFGWRESSLRVKYTKRGFFLTGLVVRKTTVILIE